MVTAVIILVLLTIAASLASWLFGQWLAGRIRISGAALAVGGAGVALIPVQDSAPLVASAAAPAQRAKPASVEQDDAMLAARRQLEQKAEMLETAERHLRWSDYAKAVDVAHQYLAEHPGDPDMSSLLARSLFAAEHPGSPSIIPAAVIAQWPSTDCVAPLRSDESSRWT
jgi:hypothetical protein